MGHLVLLVRPTGEIEVLAAAGFAGQTATDLARTVFWRLMDADHALAARLAADLDRAFPQLVEEHVARLYAIAHRYLGIPSDAEEVAQDALVRAYDALAGYDSNRIRALRLRPWLAAITINLARNRRRRIADRQPPVHLDPLAAAGWEPRAAGGSLPQAVVERREGRRELAAALLGLSPALREAVVLRHVDGLSVAETAAALGRPEGTIKAQVHRGLANLREQLSTEAQVRPDAGKEMTA
ncbi:MAG: RNA polymerase sigma factor [Chloroflexota bacterium]